MRILGDRVEYDVIVENFVGREPGRRIGLARVAAGLLDAAAAPVLERVRGHNPLLFDFMLKRLLRDGTHRFDARVFESARAFTAALVLA